MKSWVLIASTLAAALAIACAPREAEDPKNILGSDLAHDGVYGGGQGPDSPRDVQPAASAGESGGHAAATRSECEAAARHLIELGIELAIREEHDPEKKQQLIDDRLGALKSDRAKAHVSEWSRECIDRRTTRAEARCIAKIRSEADIERCLEP